METEKTAASKQHILYLNIDDITPDLEQPRKTFDQEELEALANTMETQDIINPIEVDDDNVIVTGERRWKAAIMAGKKQVPCIRWVGTRDERFERQVIENLHHSELSGMEKEDAIVKLWKTEQYNSFSELGKSVGLSRHRVSDILEAHDFREKNPDVVQNTNISTRDIAQTRDIEDTNVRKRILQAIADKTIKSSDIDEVIKVAKQSEALLDKTLEGTVSVKRALEASETIKKIEEGGVILKPEQKQRLADNIEKDQDLIKKYSEDVLDRVHKTMTTPKSEQENSTTPIGRTNPVTYIVTVKDEILANFRRHIGNCDTGERRWALKVLREIREEIEILIEVVSK
jgi:ParB family chromosome partitioning protein